MDDMSTAEAPAWKRTMLVLLALYPTVMLGTMFILPLLNNLNLVVAKFIQLGITVCLISWPLMPFTIYYLGWWLNTKSKLNNYLGTLIVIAFYLLEIAIFLRAS